jgi:hypothetical protein
MQRLLLLGANRTASLSITSSRHGGASDLSKVDRDGGPQHVASKHALVDATRLVDSLLALAEESLEELEDVLEELADALEQTHGGRRGC